jgi:X-Pro dipeptidyl-peptidase
MTARLLTVLLLALGLPSLAAAQTVGPVFEDGQAQIVPAFENPDEWIREELWVETEFDSDGDGEPDRVHVAVTRPAQTDQGLRVPVVYETSPYFAGTASLGDLFWDVRHAIGEAGPDRAAAQKFEARNRPGISQSQERDWVPRGFAVVHSSSPGTGLSEGCPTIGGSNEALAPKAVIDWLGGRARGWTAPDGGEEVVAGWSTGKVGMTGTSYNGALPVMAATTGVEGLEAIIPIAPVTSWYRYYRSNGAVRSPGGYLGEDADVLYDFVHSRDSDRWEWCNETYRDGEIAQGLSRETGDYTPFWADRDYIARVENVRAATLMAHGFNDWNVMTEHSFLFAKALEERGVPVQYYYHQQGHGGAPPMELMNRWFTRYLYDVDNGVEQDPRAWIVRENDDRMQPTPYATFPNPDAALVPLHVTPSRTLPDSSNFMGGLSLEAGADLPPVRIVDDASHDAQSLTEFAPSKHRLLYVSGPLQTPLHLSGVPRVSMRVASDSPAANVSVYLVSLPWSDGWRKAGGGITRGWADPQNSADLEGTGAPLEPGTFYDLTFDLQPDDEIIPAGQRLGLLVFSSDPDFTLLPDAGTALSFDQNAFRLDLPVVGGEAALQEALGQ